MSSFAVVSSFTKNTGVVATGLVLAEISLYLTSINMTTGAVSVIWNGTQNPTVEVTNTGSYARLYASADLDTYSYVAAAQYTGATVLDSDYVVGSIGRDESTLSTAALALVQAEAEDALETYDLDHLIQVTAGSEEPTDGSYLDQIMHKDGSQTFNAATDSLEALSDKLVKAGAAGTLSTGELTVIRGDTYDSDADNAIEGLGDISDRVSLWIVVKKTSKHTDTQATIFAEETDGITRLNGAGYGTVAHSVITVSDEVAGDLRWQLDEAVTDDLVPGLYYYDIQTLDSSGNVKTWRRMYQFTVTADVARVIA